MSTNWLLEVLHVGHIWHSPWRQPVLLGLSVFAIGSIFMSFFGPYAPPKESPLWAGWGMLRFAAAGAIGTAAAFAILLPKRVSGRRLMWLCVGVALTLSIGAGMLICYLTYADRHVGFEVNGKPFVYGDLFADVEGERKGRSISELVRERGLVDVRRGATLWSDESEVRARRNLELLYSGTCLLLGGGLIVVAVICSKYMAPPKQPTQRSSG